METDPVLTIEILMVLGVLAAAVALFITELVRVDVVAIIMMVSLPLLGLVTPKEAFSGLSSNAVVAIIAVVIIGAGLDRTGIMNQVAAPIIRFGKKGYSHLLTAICGTVALISSFMQNIGAAALFLPASMRVSKQLNIPLSRILMPMGFCAILGGTVTLVASSPLILLNDLLEYADLEPFGLFSVTPIGLMLVASGIVYFLVFGKLILPVRADAAGVDIGGALKILDLYGASGKVYELVAPPDFRYSGRTLEELQIRRSFIVTVVAIAQAGVTQKALSPLRSHRVYSNDTLAVIGHENNVRKLAESYDFQVKQELEVFAEEMSAARAGLVEAIVSPRSELVGTTLRHYRFRSEYDITPVALYREGKVFMAGIADIPLLPGDALLLHGSWRSFAKLKDSPDLLFSVPVEYEEFRLSKAKPAFISFSVAITLVIFKDILGLPISLSVCLMTGALLMVLTSVLSIDEAYEAVDWRTVFLLAGLIPLGIATEKSGAAAYIAHNALAVMGDISPLALLTVIAVLTTVFTLVISNVGATVLLVPLVISMAEETGTDPRMAALVVGLATSNSFILPTHQVNALLMGPGRYRTMDYIKAGGGMTVVFIIVTVIGLWAFYGIGGR
ncbi:MAG: SLC13 family permease [Candidatus Nitrospinota bacterium M3_3B_026]